MGVSGGRHKSSAPDPAVPAVVSSEELEHLIFRWK